MEQQSRGLAALAVTLSLALALTTTPASADRRPVVVELFTSQGCSSCPPADALLGELAARDGVVALGFHIAYWDRLGWKDPLSSPEATARQRRYAARLSGGQVYTPQLVVDGGAEMVGSDREAVLAALRRASEQRAAAPAPVDFAADRRKVTIGAGVGSGEVVQVRFARHRKTQIGAGENSGRTADDFNGVVSLSTLGRWDGATQQFAIEPPGAGDGVAVLVQAADGKMLGAGIVLGGG